MGKRLRAACWGTLTIGVCACGVADAGEPEEVRISTVSTPDIRPLGDMPIRHALSRASSELAGFRRRSTGPDAPVDGLTRRRIADLEARIQDARAGLAGMKRTSDGTETMRYEDLAAEAADIEHALQTLKLTGSTSRASFARQATLDLYVIEADLRRLVERDAAQTLAGEADARVGADVSHLRERLLHVKGSLASVPDDGRFDAAREAVAEQIGRLRRDVRLIGLLRAARAAGADPGWGEPAGQARRNR